MNEYKADVQQGLQVLQAFQKLNEKTSKSVFDGAATQVRQATKGILDIIGIIASIGDLFDDGGKKEEMEYYTMLYENIMTKLEQIREEMNRKLALVAQVVHVESCYQTQFAAPWQSLTLIDSAFRAYLKTTGSTKAFAKKRFISACKEGVGITLAFNNLMNFYTGQDGHCNFQQMNYQGSLGNWDDAAYTGYVDAMLLNDAYYLSILTQAFTFFIKFNQFTDPDPELLPYLQGIYGPKLQHVIDVTHEWAQKAVNDRKATFGANFQVAQRASNGGFDNQARMITERLSSVYNYANIFASGCNNYKHLQSFATYTHPTSVCAQTPRDDRGAVFACQIDRGTPNVPALNQASNWLNAPRSENDNWGEICIHAVNSNPGLDGITYRQPKFGDCNGPFYSNNPARDWIREYSQQCCKNEVRKRGWYWALNTTPPTLETMVQDSVSQVFEFQFSTEIESQSDLLYSKQSVDTFTQ